MKFLEPIYKFINTKKTAKRIYLDFAAATPVRKEVFEVMKPYFTEIYGNAGAIHSEGLTAQNAVEDSRSLIAKLLEVRKDDVTFTSGGTESNNLAIYGTVRFINNLGTSLSDIEIISDRAEHPSTLRALEHLSSMGATVLYADITKEGLIDEKHLKELLSTKTTLVTFAYANSETGVVQNVKRITRMVRLYNKDNNTSIRTHLDASQAPLWLPIQMDTLGIDMMTLDAGKCCGPKGVGVLAHRHNIKLGSIMLGGSQEGGLRAGTENTPSIIGCAEALKIAMQRAKERSFVVAKLRDYMLGSIFEKIEGCILNGSKEYRLANNINISISGIDSEFAVISLDSKGVACSTRSACGAGDGEGSYVIKEMTQDEKRAKSTIRFSLGEETTKNEIDKTVEILAAHVSKMRAFQDSLT